MPRKRKEPKGFAFENKDPALGEFTRAVSIGLLFLRANLSRHGVCPVCYCNAIQRCLEKIKTEYQHNDIAEPLTVSEVHAVAFDLGLEPETELLLMTCAEGGTPQ